MPDMSNESKIPPTREQDPFGNFMAQVNFPDPCERFSVRVGIRAELRRINPFDFFIEEEFRDYPFQYGAGLAGDLAPYLRLDEQGPLLAAYAKTVSRGKRHVIGLLAELNQRINSENRYLVRLEPGVQGCDETLKLRSGSCRDL